MSVTFEWICFCLVYVSCLISARDSVPSEISLDFSDFERTLELSDDDIKEGRKDDEYNTVYMNECKCKNGRCGIQGHETVCICPPEFGKHSPTYCKECFCGKDSNCTFENIGFFSYDKHCICKPGFQEIDGKCVGPCQHSKPCKNGGLCIENDDGYTCKCPSAFMGINCEKKRPCQQNPCKNGGSCIDHTDGYQCVCDEKYVGKHCENLRLCSSNPCQHDSLCLDLKDGYKCYCHPGYCGTNCDIICGTLTTEQPISLFSETTTEIGSTPGIKHTSDDLSNFTDVFDFTVSPFNFTRDLEYNRTTYEPSNFTYDFNLTTEEPYNFTMDFNITTYEPSNFTHYFNQTTDEPHNFTVDFDRTTYYPYNFTHDFNLTTDEPYNFTVEFNITTYEPSNFTHNFNWTTEKPYNFTADFNETTYEPSNFTYYFNLTTDKPYNFTVDFNRTTYETTSKPSTSTVRSCDCGVKSYDCKLSYNGRQICSCLPGYAQIGKICSDCYCGENSENCSFDLNANKICVCSKGYAQRQQSCSKTCSKDGDCLNGGLCRREADGSVEFCQCKSNFRGDRCEVNVICSKLNPVCEAIGAVCKIREMRPVCECTPDKAFSPDSGFCEDICDDQKCVHGKCEIAGSNFKCKCDEGYSGIRCDGRGTHDLDSELLWVAFFSLILAILILLTGTCCLASRALCCVTSAKLSKHEPPTPIAPILTDDLPKYEQCW